MRERSCEQLVELLPRNTAHFISPLLPCQVLTLLLGAIWVTALLLSCDRYYQSRFYSNKQCPSWGDKSYGHPVHNLSHAIRPAANSADLISAKMTTGNHNPKWDNSRKGAEATESHSPRAGASCAQQRPLQPAWRLKAKPKHHQPVSHSLRQALFS